jgi:hypothetical protein
VSITIVRKKRNTPMSGPGRYEEFRLQGFHDARDGVYHPEGYAKGMARRAYAHGKEQWVELMAQER